MKKMILIAGLSLGLFAETITIQDTKNMLVNECVSEKNSKKVCECAEELTHREYDIFGITINLNLEQSPDYDGEASDYLTSYDEAIVNNIKQCKKSKGKIPADKTTLNQTDLELTIKSIMMKEFEKDQRIPESVAENALDCLIEIREPYTFAKKYTPNLKRVWYYSAINSGYITEQELSKSEKDELKDFSKVMNHTLSEYTMKICMLKAALAERE